MARADKSWHTSTRSFSTNCVEVAVPGDVVLVRDSKDRGGPVLAFRPAQWRAFLHRLSVTDRPGRR